VGTAVFARENLIIQQLELQWPISPDKNSPLPMLTTSANYQAKWNGKD
jgi:hypothetical protein